MRRLALALPLLCAGCIRINSPTIVFGCGAGLVAALAAVGVLLAIRRSIREDTTLRGCWNCALWTRLNPCRVCCGWRDRSWLRRLVRKLWP